MAYAPALLDRFPAQCPQHWRCSAPALAPLPAQYSTTLSARRQHRQRPISVRAEADDGFEGRLSKLKGKGGKKQETPREALKQAQEDEKKGGQPKYDFTSEEVYLETAPHRGDLALNVALGTTLLWLPLTIASVARGAFVKYRFTNMRVSVTTKAGPLRDEQLDAAYQEVSNIQTVGRAFGAWGDMVITLKGGDKIELRAVPRYKELEEYVLKRRDELKGSNLNPKSAAAQPVQAGKGF